MTQTARTIRAVALAVMAAAVTPLCADEPSCDTVRTAALRPVTSETLRPVQSVSPHIIYKSNWTDELTTQPIVRATHKAETTVPTAVPDDAQPFLDLTQPNNSASSSLASSSPETNALFSRLAIWTVIVLCLCVLTVLGLRRWQRRQGLLPASRGQAKILETLALGPGRAVSLVQLGEHQAFVGTDSGGISAIVLAPPVFGDALDALETPAANHNTSQRIADQDAAQSLGFPGTFSS